MSTRVGSTMVARPVATPSEAGALGALSVSQSVSVVSKTASARMPTPIVALVAAAPFG
jgi:hypothetical protein